MRYVSLLLLMAGACSRAEAPAPQKDVKQETPPVAAVAPTNEAAEASAPSERVEPQSETTLSLETPPSLELLDKGKPPRRELRATFEPGSKQTLEVKTEGTREDGFGVFIYRKYTMPSYVYEVETEAKELAPDGNTRFEFRVTKVVAKLGEQARPGAAKGAKKTAESMQGITGSFLINTRGMLEAFHIAIPPKASTVVHDMADQIARALRLASLPLPEEPVGKGAKWAVSQVIEHRGVRSTQISTFELLSAKGARVRAKMTYQQTAPKQKFSPPGAPNKIFVLREVIFEGGGEGTWQLGQLAPRSASEKTSTLIRMMTVGPKPEGVATRTEATLKVQKRR